MVLDLELCSDVGFSSIDGNFGKPSNECSNSLVNDSIVLAGLANGGEVGCSSGGFRFEARPVLIFFFLRGGATGNEFISVLT